MTDHVRALELIEWIEGARYKSEKNGLANMRALLEKLGNAETKFPSCHVAGTNGKGSVCAMTESVLRAAGYKTGLYTSPYLCAYNERVCVNGTPISDNLLVECGEQVQQAALSLMEDGIKCTAFELGTALAFLVFAHEKVDIAVIETGLGGRLDSTNVLSPVCCAITAIGLDHTAILGDTMEQIAFEKAGIIKENTPVALYPERITSVNQVFTETAAQKNAKILPAETLPLENLRFDARGCSFTHRGTELRVPLPGRHQAKNAALALAFVQLLRENGFPVTDAALKQGLLQTKWPARLDYVKDNLLVDGAHNPHGASSLCAYIKEFCSDKKILLVTGMMRDKHPEECASLLANIASEIIATQVDWPRALPCEELAQIYQSLGKPARAVATPKQALQTAFSLADSNTIILVAGSLYLAGDVLKQEG